VRKNVLLLTTGAHLWVSPWPETTPLAGACETGFGIRREVCLRGKRIGLRLGIRGLLPGQRGRVRCWCCEETPLDDLEV